MRNGIKFVIITPVRNEEKYISITMKCMLQQTLTPAEWIIVNDGSTDKTGEIINDLMKGNNFIKYIYVKDRGYREPGKGVIETFYKGYSNIERTNFDVLAKFDADLEFPDNTLEKIAKAFNEDDKLGITGGTRYERLNDQKDFKQVKVPKGFVGGPFKFYRRECFEDIGGLVTRAGWDGVDTVKANMKGWRTGEIESLRILHLKPTGTATGEGLKKACEKYGDVAYFMGGYVWYFIFRILGRSLESGNPSVGYYMLKGYLKSKMKGLPRESDEFRKFLKRKQIFRFQHWVKLIYKHT